MEHRLPENHECTFNLKQTPVVPKFIHKPYTPPIRYPSSSQRDRYDYQWREKRSYQTRYNRIKRFQREVPSKSENALLTNSLIALITILSFVFIFFPQELSFSISKISNLPFSLITILTSPFISSSSVILFDFFFIHDYVGLTFTIIILFVYYDIIRKAENAFGRKLFISIFFLSVLLSAFFYVLLRVSIIQQYPIDGMVICCTGFATSGIIGIISYTVFVYPSKDWRFIYPIRINGRILLGFIILFKFCLWVTTTVLYMPYIVFNLPDLSGLVIAYIIFKIKIKDGGFYNET
jgi:hypothetical protein